MDKERLIIMFGGIELMPVKTVLKLSRHFGGLVFFAFFASKFNAVFRRLYHFLMTGFGLTGLVKIDDIVGHYRGLIISSGRTTLSNSFLVTKPSLTASSRKVVPFLCAVLATLVALS